MASEAYGISTTSIISSTIDAHSDELIDRWKVSIRTINPGAAEGILHRLSKEIEVGQDLLSLLRAFPANPDDLSDEHVAPLVQCVAGTNCTVADFHTEIDALETAFASVLKVESASASADAHAILTSVHLLLSQTFAKVMESTATIYKHAVEEDLHALCRVNPDGIITFANSAMADLFGTAPLSGRPLADFFAGEDRTFLIQAFQSAREKPTAREAQLKWIGSASKRLWLTVQPMILNGNLTGFYVTATDASLIVAREERFLDRLELPAIKLDQDSVITYANPATRLLIGADTDLRGRSVFEIFPNVETMSDQLEKRRKGKGDIYDTEIKRTSDGKRIPVRVAGAPILDDNGNFLGTLGIIRSRERQKAAEAIHRFISSERDERALLTKLAEQIQMIVPFDWFIINEYSRSSDHMSPWFTYSIKEPIETSRRWWPIPSDQKEEAKQPKVEADLQVFLQKYPDLLKDPIVQRFLAQDFHSMLRIPIKRQDQTVSSMLLMSKLTGLYSNADLEVLRSLPVEQAIQMALYYKDLRDSQFRDQLFKAMARCRTAAKLAGLLAQKLAEHYDWDHVIVVDVCKDEGVFRILAETSPGDTHKLSVEQFRQPLTAGILGYVYQKGTAVNIASVHEHELREEFICTWPGTQSELCLPIVWDNEIQWVLNVEDETLDAFSKDEEQEVSAILREVELVLQRISRQYLLESTLDSTSDAVLVTDTRQNILQANPAAARLLRYSSPNDLLGPFERIFKDTATAQRVFASTNCAAAEVDLARSDGSTLPVLISGSDLAEDLFRKLFVATDLTEARRLEKLESLRNLFQEVALQTHTPLALIETWVQRAAREDRENDLYGKILSQLKKLEITYDRLAISTEEGTVFESSRRLPLDIGVELKRIREEFPESEQRVIHYEDPGDLPYTEADPGQITFIFSTILSYLTRLCGGEQDGVNVSISRSARTLRVHFKANAPLPPDAMENARALSRARFDLALGEPAIRSLAASNQVLYAREADESGTTIGLTFTIAG
jgi:PAS domain S-box-containing protein